MEYYFELKKPDEFRYNVISGVKELLILQTQEEKLELIRQAKKDISKEIEICIKELDDHITRLEQLLADDELKKEIKHDLEKKAQEIIKAEKEAKLKTITQPITKTISQTKEQAKIKKEKDSPKIKTTEEEPQQQSLSSLSSLEYSLEKIERKLAELKKD